MKNAWEGARSGQEVRNEEGRDDTAGLRCGQWKEGKQPLKVELTGLDDLRGWLAKGMEDAGGDSWGLNVRTRNK